MMFHTTALPRRVCYSRKYEQSFTQRCRSALNAHASFELSYYVSVMGEAVIYALAGAGRGAAPFHPGALNYRYLCRYGLAGSSAIYRLGGASNFYPTLAVGECLS